MNTDTRRWRPCSACGAGPSLTSTTLPSAPESTIPSRLGAVRSGSRKNQVVRAPITRMITPTAGNRSKIRISPPASSGRAIFSPSGASGKLRRSRPEPCGGARCEDKAATAGSVFGFVHQPVAGQPRHVGAQLATDFLNRILLAFLAQAAEVGHPGPIFTDPFLGKLTRLNVGQDFLHRLARPWSHHPLAAGHIAVFRRVADRIA